LILRRILEAAAGTLPLLAVLVLPVLCGLPFVSEYTQWQPLQTTAELHFKAVWLSAPLVLVRAVIYFGCWIGLARLFRGWSRRQDEGTGWPHPRTLRGAGRARHPDLRLDHHLRLDRLGHVARTGLVLRRFTRSCSPSPSLLNGFAFA